MAEIFDRKAVRDRLNKQRNRLKNKGATPTELAQYFGVNYSIPFGSLSDNDLKAVLSRIDKAERVTVVNGYIYPERYIRARKLWDDSGSGGKVPLVKGYKNALNTTFINKDKTLADTKSRIKERERAYINLYADSLEELGLKSIASSIRKSSYKRVKEFVISSQNILDLSEIIQYTSDGMYTIGFDDEDYASAIAGTLSQVWSQFNKRSVKRNK